ncbi:MAG: exo-alpha-sialidase [Thermoplasmata archaeon]|nr:MAG: exo-alpha-sialidase [Thermoplasmata archaeon]
MRKKLLSIMFVFAIGLSSISITTASTDIGDWSEDIRLTFNDGRSLFPAIAVEGNNIHVAYIDNEGAGYLEMFLWYINSRDRGNTWNPPICLVSGPSTKALHPKIAVNGSNIHVIWCESDDKRIHYIRSTDNGNTWSPEIAITPIMYDNFPNWDIGVYENNLHVVYSDSNHKLSYIHSNDNGFTWSVPEILIPNRSVSIETAIAVNENNVHIVWRDTERAGHLIPDIFYIKSRDNGVTWEKDINITSTPTNSNYYVDIAHNNDYIYVVYGHKESKRQVYFSYSEDNGNTWVKNIKLSNSTHNIFDPAISAENDNIYIVWEDDRDKGGSLEIYFKSSFDRGNTWSVDTRLTVAPETSVSPDIVVNENMVHVVWADYRDGNHEIYFKQILLPFPSISAGVDINPNTFNLKSKGRWIACYITMNSSYDVNDIDISTVILEDTIPAEWGDIQGDTLMVKFDRSEVEDMLSPGTYNLKVTGELTDGTKFEGYSDGIRAIDPVK